jgi:hypothetical protein
MSKQFVCGAKRNGEKCGREFASVDGMESHLRNYHGIEPKGVPNVIPSTQQYRNLLMLQRRVRDRITKKKERVNEASE